MHALLFKLACYNFGATFSRRKPKVAIFKYINKIIFFLQKIDTLIGYLEAFKDYFYPQKFL